MNKKILIAGIAGFAVLAGATLVLLLSDAGRENATHPLIDQSNQSLVLRGQEVYAGHCASCHGAKLEGQPEWRTRRPGGRLPAPPHDETGHTWHHSDALLFDIVKNGLVPGKTAPAGYESDMPAFGQVLSDADIIAVLAYIKSRWPREALEAQENVTLQRDRK